MNTYSNPALRRQPTNSGNYVGLTTDPGFPTSIDVKNRVVDQAMTDLTGSDLHPSAAFARSMQDPHFAREFYRDQVLALNLFEWLLGRHLNTIAACDREYEKIGSALVVQQEKTDAVAEELDAAHKRMKELIGKVELQEVWAAKPRELHDIELAKVKEHTSNTTSEYLVKLHDQQTAALEKLLLERADDVTTLNHRLEVASNIANDLTAFIDDLLPLLPIQHRRRAQRRYEKLLQPTPQPNPVG